MKCKEVPRNPVRKGKQRPCGGMDLTPDTKIFISLVEISAICDFLNDSVNLHCITIELITFVKNSVIMSVCKKIIASNGNDPAFPIFWY